MFNEEFFLCRKRKIIDFMYRVRFRAPGPPPPAGRMPAYCVRDEGDAGFRPTEGARKKKEPVGRFARPARQPPPSVREAEIISFCVI